jgi:hypothetical protein
LAFNYYDGNYFPHARGAKIYATPIDEEFKAKVSRPTLRSYSYRGVSSMVEHAKEMQQWFHNAMKGFSEPCQNIKFNICTFGSEGERFRGQQEFVRLVPAFDIGCKATFWTERPSRSLTPSKYIYFDDCNLEIDIKNGVLLPRSDNTSSTP